MKAPQPTVTNIHAVAVPVDDQDRAVEFYVRTLGFEKRRDMPFGPGRWIEVAPSGATTSIALAPKRVDMAAGVDTGIRLTTPDAEAAHAALIASGVEVDAEIMRMGERVPPMFAFHDLDGNRLVMVQQ